MFEFRNLCIRGHVIVQAIVCWLLLAPVAVPSEPMPTSFSNDFRDGEFDVTALQLRGGDSPTQFCKSERDGLRIVLPRENGPDWAAVGMRFEIHGDFEISAGYRILNLSIPDAGTGTGLSISVKDDDGRWATVQRVCNLAGKQLYIAHLSIPVEGGDKNSSHVSQPAQEEIGRLMIKRTGDVLEYLIADGENARLVKIREVKFSSSIVPMINLGAKKGGANADVEIIWTDISISADGIVYELERKPKSMFRGRWIWQSLSVVACMGLIGGGWYFIRRKRKLS